MSPMPERDYDATVACLETLVGTHYRPKGKDAAASFANLAVWVDVRGPWGHVALVSPYTVSRRVS